MTGSTDSTTRDAATDDDAAKEVAPLIAQRPKRADGRRNYDAILAAARTAFAEHGAGASLEDIAAKAGVAIGTLYRHFPTRATLVEASTRNGLEDLVAHAKHVSGTEEPLAALVAWMRQAVLHFSTFRGLVGILVRSMYDEGTPSHAMCAQMHGSGADLLTAAQDAGAIRADLTPVELFDLLHGIAWVRETTGPERDDSDRLIDLLVGGLTAR
ncbi:helix-turn-helix domain-containing protein [Actinokineospora auranticolor]|uniref:AcrR family transcriptional regulator n=1 Tax=Actinokineospora auranticolor TaxID=155976 RepID=A0A2S6H1T8_9PSEU|nr:TetR/AcrR family transcriptional regulator [Actinokineospora auranticolor]PPK71424.1 AcrR family transcriptional regulator [Actinokineospora auranticolor]